MLELLLFAVGLVMIILGGNYFVDSAVAIAKKTKISLAVIGATIVSLATTLPEILVSVIASARGSFELAVGNGVGSMIANLALILGIVFCSIRLVAHKKNIGNKLLFLLGITVFLLVCSLDNVIAWWEAVLLIGTYAMFMTLNLKEAKQSSQVLQVKHLYVPEQSTSKTILFFVLGTVGIAVGAVLLVEYGSALAIMMGISEYIVGVTMVAVGTSLPELVTAIQSIKKNNAALTVGNVIGANMINGSLLIGLSGLVSGGRGLPISEKTVLVSLPMLIVSSLIVAVPLFWKGKTFRFQGIALIVSYFIYLALLVFAV